MTIDWNSVRKQALWGYEDLIRKLQIVLAYDFVQRHYDHTMKQARAYARKIHRGYLQDRDEKAPWINNLVSDFAVLEERRVGTYSGLVSRVATREDCRAFLLRTGLEFDRLITILTYLFRWVLPFQSPLRELIDVDDDAGAGYLDALHMMNLRSNLDLLEVGRTDAARARLSRAAGVPDSFVTALVHRADISRLAYVRGKTVRHLCGGGYVTLEKIAAAGVAEMESNMDAYYRTLGRTLADFKSVVQLPWLIGGAKTLPRIVKT